LEFFGPLFDQDRLAAGLKRLKRLQDALGVSNDLCVQQAALASYLAEKLAPQNPSLLLAAAVGGLIGVLHQRRSEERRKVAVQVRRFCTTDTAAALECLCQPVRRAA